MKFKVDGILYPVIVEKKKNKNTYIRVKEQCIYITTSQLATKAYLLKTLEENEESIKKMLEKDKKRKVREDSFYYLGQKYDIIITDIDHVKFDHNIIYTQDEKMLDIWMMNQFQSISQKRMDFYYHKIKETISYPTLKYRNMKTRWGVYNKRTGCITLNTKLIGYSIDEIDYVIVHELCHLIHFDHSKEFWKKVETYFPSYKEARKVLKES